MQSCGTFCLRFTKRVKIIQSLFGCFFSLPFSFTSGSSARQLFPFNTPKLMFSLAPARCNGTWHRVSDGEAERPFSPRLPSCCWRPRGRRPAGRRRRGEPLSTEPSRRSAPLDTFDQHISIRFHIRTPAFAQLAPASYPCDWPKWEVRRKMRSKFLFFPVWQTRKHMTAW